MTSRSIRVRFQADDGAPFTLMIEPWGMTYDLVGSEAMFVELDAGATDDVELVYWAGGVSICGPGRARTFDSTGSLLHEF
ncbi:hypothetical protein [Aeromicrobium sp. CnD17-E]|uniref:hypothetical protein n=1 Tax=Aeromicrobium sp. CnD17-E TaxID=2954487 RepID=UPI002097373C|nr:hypothetical protein [Aeromicrobium sp. CnD17-E]MCO7238918.1 hypothetical protein [Aeromicrobium sp. CnD17-E]